MGLIEWINEKYLDATKDNLRMLRELGVSRLYRKAIVKQSLTLDGKLTLRPFILRSELRDNLNLDIGYSKLMKRLEKISGITYSSQFS